MIERLLRRLSDWTRRNSGDGAARSADRAERGRLPPALVAGLRSMAAIRLRLAEAGSSPRAAVELARAQVRGLRALVAHEQGWARVVRLGRIRGFDSWLAADWPDGFDELLLCAPLCEWVAFECGRCPLGRRQQGRSCAHPTTAIGRLAELLRIEDRPALAAQLDHIEAEIDHIEAEIDHIEA